MRDDASENRSVMTRVVKYLRRRAAAPGPVVRKGRIGKALKTPDAFRSPAADAGVTSMAAYLALMCNTAEDVEKYRRIRALPRQIVEIGCGTGNMASEIALKNPDIGVVATDRFDCGGPCSCGSGYRRVALAWQERRLEAQRHGPENLAVLRAEIDILAYLPPRSVDTVMMINPEPSVGAVVINALAAPPLYEKLKPGGSVLVVPFSREMGVMTCGGLEFDHGPDWSRGLGFLFSSPLAFHPGPPRHWGVDFTASGYSRNSTQRGVYIHHVPVV